MVPPGRTFFFSSRRRHTKYWRDWSSDVCSSDLDAEADRFLLENGARRAGIRVGGGATGGEGQPLAVGGHLEGQAVHGERDSGRASGGEDPSPVRVGAVDRGLHEGRAGNRPAHVPRGGFAPPPHDGNPNALRPTLAIRAAGEREG